MSVLRVKISGKCYEIGWGYISQEEKERIERETREQQKELELSSLDEAMTPDLLEDWYEYADLDLDLMEYDETKPHLNEIELYLDDEPIEFDRSKIRIIREPPFLKPDSENPVFVCSIVKSGYIQCTFRTDKTIDISDISLNIVNLKNLGIDHEFIDSVLFKGKVGDEDEDEETEWGYSYPETERLFFLG